MKWGFSAQSLIINARVETAAVKPMFKDAWKSHRCVVPASHYYEWEHIVANDGKKHTGDKYLIQPRSSEITWLCGLYRFENDMPVYVILTREPNAEIAAIHDRMPLVIAEQDVAEWIHPDGNAEEIARRALTEMTMQQAG